MHVYPLVPPHVASGEVMRLGVELAPEKDEARVEVPKVVLLAFVLEGTEDDALLDDTLLEINVEEDEIPVETADDDFEVDEVTEDDEEALVEETVDELDALLEDSEDELDTALEDDNAELETELDTLLDDADVD